MQILVVDDEKEIADLVALYLRNEGYKVQAFYHPVPALESTLRESYDLAILDVMLPGMDGFSLCRKLREKYNWPIIMLTAKTEDMDKINGLTIGADDYITKPFNPLELVARVKAQLRRYRRYNELQTDTDEPADTIDVSGLSICKTTHACTLNGKPVHLTPIEFNILWFLCERRGEVVSSEDIFQQVWGERYLDCNNTVMVHIRRLREKLHEPPRNPKIIKTVWGVGYKVGK
ncbi:MAG: VanR-ABDEGLN family response regulator transcription factor [Clostridia bacterium]|nr:VanR-ABDEGLN family response regulator transcription factor [Clostridia bacterium]